MAFVSVDGGATKTIAVCYDSEGNILGVSASGPSNFRNIGIESASSNIISAVRNSIERSGLGNEKVQSITFALAGVKDSQRSTEIIDNFIEQMNFKAPYLLLNDGEAGYNCRFFEERGIIAAAGTGMIAFGKFNEKFERTSGWGWLIGDEGGAFYIGKRAIQESAKIADGRNSGKPDLLKMVMNYFEVTEPRQLVNEVYTNPINIRRIAMIAKEVSTLANSGDATSQGILKEAAKEAARCVVALKKQYNAEDLPVSGYGGVFRAGQLFWNTFKEAVLEDFPGTTFKEPLFGFHAVLGSMYLVLKERGIKPPDTGKILNDFNSNIESLPVNEKTDYLLM